MSLLNNPSFITFGGEPVTGRAPPKVVVNGPEMTPQQRGAVAHAYKLFCDAVNVSALSEGYHVQNRTFPDGTKVRVTSIAGRHEVMVRTSGGGTEESLPSGVGICFTKLDGSPVTGWSCTDADGAVLPQPFIMSQKTSALDGVFTPSGKWSVTKVSRLVGGQKLWVNQKRKQWLSMFSEGELQAPASIYGGVGPAIRYVSPAKLMTTRPKWVAVSHDRILSATDNFGRTDSKYVLSLNNTVALLPDLRDGTAAPFLTKKLTCVLVIVTNNNRWPPRSLRLYYGPRKARTGLAKEDANLSGVPPMAVLDQEPLDGLVPGSLSVHPDGLRARCMIQPYSNPAKSATFAEIAIADPETPADAPTLTLTYSAGEFAPLPTTVFAGSLTDSSTEAVTPRYGRISTVGVGCPVMDYPNGNVVADGEPFPYSYSVPGAQKLVRTESRTGALTATQTHTTPNRFYYDPQGKAVTDSVTFSKDESYTVDSRTVMMVDPGDTIETDTSSTSQRVPSTYSFLATVSRATKSSDTLLLGTRSFAAREADFTQSVTTTESWNSPAQSVFQQDRPSDAVTTADTITAEGGGVETMRHILFYDDVNDFIIYLETVTTCVLAGSAATANGVAGMASATATCSLIGSLAGDTVFSTVVSPRPVTCVFSVGGVRGQKTTSPGTATSRPMSEQYTANGALQCSTSAAYYPAPAPATYTWTENDYTSTTSDVKGFNGVTFWTYPDKYPQRYMHVEFARDAQSMATVCNLTFKGSSYDGSADKSWIFVVDKTGFKTLQEVLNPSGSTAPTVPADVVIWEAASLHSLVSI